MRSRSVAGLVACGALFGLSYVLVRAVVPVLGPVAVTSARTLLGGTVLVAVVGVRRLSFRPSLWRRYLVLGALSAAVPFTLISVATLTLDAGTSAVLNASAPAFALIIGAALHRRWPGAPQILGMVVALAGVVLVVTARGAHLDGGGGVGIAAGLLGAAVFAYAGFYAAGRFPGVPVVALASGQQFAACALLAPLVVLVPPSETPDASALWNLLALGLLGSGLAYLLFYWLIGVEGAAWTANVNLLVPGFGVLWGWLLLREPVPGGSVAGMALTVVGLALVLRTRP